MCDVMYDMTRCHLYHIEDKLSETRGGKRRICPKETNVGCRRVDFSNMDGTSIDSRCSLAKVFAFGSLFSVHRSSLANTLLHCPLKSRVHCLCYIC